MPRRPIKHAGIKVKKEKEEKKRKGQRKPLPKKQLNHFTVTLRGMRQKTTYFCPFAPKGFVDGFFFPLFVWFLKKIWNLPYQRRQ